MKIYISFKLAVTSSKEVNPELRVCIDCKEKLIILADVIGKCSKCKSIYILTDLNA